MLNPPASPLKFPRLLLTGAGGNLGKELRPRLKSYCDVLRLSHRSDLGTRAPGEEIMLASLENKEQMMALMSGVDAVVHMGGVSTEQPWDPILASNIVGMVNLYEAARLQGTQRRRSGQYQNAAQARWFLWFVQSIWRGPRRTLLGALGH